jgi:hypothetical protein
MTIRSLAVAALAALSSAGCVTRAHLETSALRMAWPTDAPGIDARLGRENAAYPSAGGDILKGTSPETLAVARAAASQALTDSLAKP